MPVSFAFYNGGVNLDDVMFFHGTNEYHESDSVIFKAEKSLVLLIYFLFRLKSNNNRTEKTNGECRIFINRMQSNSSQMQSNSNWMQSDSNRKAIEHSSNQSQKTLENSIDSINRKTIERLYSIKFDWFGG